jgi:hypothetical protein
MRADITEGARLADYELPDHTDVRHGCECKPDELACVWHRTRQVHICGPLRQATACSGPFGGRAVRRRPLTCFGSGTVFLRCAVRGGRRATV